jgi:hypothetical protein
MSKPITPEPEGSFRRYWEQQRRANEAATPARAYRAYRKIGYSPKGARAMVALITDPPGGPPTAQDWRTEGVEPFAPAEFLSLFEAVMTFYGRPIVMPKPRHIEDIEHWIGRPFKSELPDSLSVSTEELCPPETEHERIRRCSWTLAQELLAALADGTLPTAPGRQAGGNLYAQVIRTADFLRWAKARGGYDESFSELLRQRKVLEPAQPHGGAETTAPASAPRRKGRPDDERQRVITELKAAITNKRHTAATLNEAKKESLAKEFNTSRWTLRKALPIALAQMAQMAQMAQSNSLQ